MTYDMVVIGGGFWGSSCARHAQEQGISVFQIDCGKPQGGSRNAAGIVHRQWFERGPMAKLLPTWWMPEDLEYSVDWLTRHCGLKHTGESFYNLTRPNAQPKHRKDCYLLPTIKHLARLDACAPHKVKRIVRRGAGRPFTLECDDAALETRSVVVAAGAWADKILRQSDLPPLGIEPLRGRALVARPQADLAALKDGVPIAMMTRPYKSYTAREWEGSRVRFGDTVEYLKGDDRELNHLRALAERYAPNCVVDHVLDGVRPLLARFHVEEVCHGLIAATGGGRVGLTAAPAAGRRAVLLARRAL